jgi:multicomponent Na+:H+ antiporter subunit B
MITIFADIHSIANIVILFFLVVIAVAVIRSRNLITAAALLSVFSMLMASEYLVLGAADVAITEAAVGAGISTILLLLGIFLVGSKEKRRKNKNLLPFLLIISVMALLIYASGQLPVFGAKDTPAQKHVASYYITNNSKDTGVANVVTSVLASYRGYDTLGETIVIFTAAIAVFMLLGRVPLANKRT